MKEVIVLGNLLSVAAVRVDPSKVEVILIFRTPKKLTQVHGFIRYVGYYRHFIEINSKLSFPLFQLLPKDAEFVWPDECETIFVKIKELVCKAPILHGPDWKLPFHIPTDSFHTTVGVVLGQHDDKKPYVIYYSSKNLTPPKLNYMVIEEEFGCYLCY